jgi:hypothetical protein
MREFLLQEFSVEASSFIFITSPETWAAPPFAPPFFFEE